MAWGAYVQGNEQFQELESLGSELSIQISCPVHFPAFGKNLFECKCEVTFPVYLVRSRNWDKIRQRHEGKEGVT